MIGGMLEAAPRKPLRVLHVEDSESDSALVMRELRRGGFDPSFERVQTRAAFKDALREKDWDVIISDYALPGYNGAAALADAQETGRDIPFILVSGTIGEETAVDAMRAGAHDYVLKNRLGRLAPAVARELNESKEREARRVAEVALRESERRLRIDVTERKQAEAGRARAEEALRQSEQQLRQSQKMEAVGRLAGGVAHDFNNVLSVILSYSELMLADVKPGEPIRDDIEEIRKAGRRAAALTRQLLTFSHQQVLDPKVLDLNDVLASMDNMLQRVLGADVNLVVLPAPALGRVRVDPSSIEMVMMNLVVNARDAMPTGGTLTIRTTNAVLDEAYARAHVGAKPGAHVMLAVTDTGTGIDEAILARIFEPFFTTKAIGQGTGLGLSTVFGVAQQSGGSVCVDSKLGVGTTFKLYLPRVDAAIDGARVTEPPPASLRGSETILLVEDDDQVRVVARGILCRNGYSVVEARSAGEALLHSEKHPGTIHLLLSDVVMPQMSGPELANRLSSVRPRMKVLCMSGCTDDSAVRRGVIEAHIAYLQKPFTPDALSTRVREVLDGP
jgi:signal transduction histidine kinase